MRALLDRQSLLRVAQDLLVHALLLHNSARAIVCSRWPHYPLETAVCCVRRRPHHVGGTGALYDRLILWRHSHWSSSCLSRLVVDLVEPIQLEVVPLDISLLLPLSTGGRRLAQQILSPDVPCWLETLRTVTHDASLVSSHRNLSVGDLAPSTVDCLLE